MGNKFRKQYGQKPEDPESANNQTGKNDDPRVRAFVRDFTPAINQDDPDTKIFTQPELRKLFNAYQSAAGFDPLVKILNQLDNHGFHLQMRAYKDELVIVVKRMISIYAQEAVKLPLPENN